MLMVVGGPVELDEDLPPQLARAKLMASKHISTAARRVALRASSIGMILEANLAVALVQWRGIRSVSAFNPACHIKLPGRLHGTFEVNCGASRRHTSYADTAPIGKVVGRWEVYRKIFGRW
jgi:hypothetical protein